MCMNWLEGGAEAEVEDGGVCDWGLNDITANTSTSMTDLTSGMSRAANNCRASM